MLQTELFLVPSSRVLFCNLETLLEFSVNIKSDVEMRQFGRNCVVSCARRSVSINVIDCVVLTLERSKETCVI